jgi:hypothetical protein
MDVAQLFTLVRPALAPIRYVLAVRAAEPVGHLGGGNLAESLRSLHDVLGRMLPLRSRPKAETTEELPRMPDLLGSASLPLEFLERSSLHKSVRVPRARPTPPKQGLSNRHGIARPYRDFITAACIS